MHPTAINPRCDAIVAIAITSVANCAPRRERDVIHKVILSVGIAPTRGKSEKSRGEGDISLAFDPRFDVIGRNNLTSCPSRQAAPPKESASSGTARHFMRISRARDSTIIYGSANAGPRARGWSRNAIEATWIFERIPRTAPDAGPRHAPAPRVRAGTSWELSLLPQWNDVKRFRLPRHGAGRREDSESLAKSRSSFIGNKRAGDLLACEANQTSRRLSFEFTDWLPWRMAILRVRTVGTISRGIGCTWY